MSKPMLKWTSTAKTASNGGYSWYVSGCCADLIDVDRTQLIGTCRKCGAEVCRLESIGYWLGSGLYAEHRTHTGDE